MNDPHVTSVVYSVGSGPGIEYDDPPPLIHESALGVFRLSQGRLQVTPTKHFAREEEARSAIEPFLRAWEAEADLVANPETIRFTFVSADVVDRNPEPNVVTGRLVATLGSVTVLGSAVTLTLRRRSYPEPPRSFRLTEEAEIALRRWRRYLAGTEPLQAMAYFVLTLLNAQSRPPLSAARLFAIESPILKKIGELSSTRGDALNARKVNSEARFTPLTGTEQQWLETAVRKLILRLGEYGTGTPLTPIRVKDLPFP
jgi:hypothetical protein